MVEDLELYKCQSPSIVSHLRSFISANVSEAVAILDPLSGSMKVSTREELEISFNTGVR